MIQLQNLSKHYGSQVVFERAHAFFGDEQKIGVIGRNGSGKTTLCRLILGQEEPDEGEIRRSPGLTIGCLEQRDSFQPGETVLAFFERTTGREEWACGKMAARFRLKQEELESRIESLPGGYQTRVKLAAVLLQQPDYLILDEPSNYLDLKTLLLLERFLLGFKGGFLLVSHDREFLKRTCDHTLEAGHGRLFLYPGNVEEYLQFRQQERDLAERYNANLESEQRRLQRFIDRFRAKATKAAQVQSKIKLLDRQQKIEIEHAIRTVRIRLPRIEPKRGAALSCSNLEIGYPGKSVARDIFLEIERGQHIAVLGDNGEGKTTFLRTLAGELPPRAGGFRWGHGLRPSYYAQHVHTALDPGEEVFDFLQKQAASDVTRQEILDLAGSFLFSGEDLAKTIGVLSGGECARLCLAGLLLSKNPVLLLDEPTNHLDFETVEALGSALREYEGTLFFISHDRTFVQLVATGILEVKAGSITHYPDSYESYVYHLETLCREIEENPETGTESGRVGRVNGSSPPKSAYHVNRERQSRIRKLNSQIRKTEERMAGYEQERKALLQFFIDRPMNATREHALRLEELNRLVQEEEARWLSAQEELEGLRTPSDSVS